MEVGEAAGGADGVYMPLGQHRAQPGLQRTSPVEVTEEGSAIGAFANAVEFSKQGVCQFPGGRRVWRTTQKKGCDRAQVAAICCDEVIPGGGVAFGTAASERQILQVE